MSNGLFERFDFLLMSAFPDNPEQRLEKHRRASERVCVLMLLPSGDEREREKEAREEIDR